MGRLGLITIGQSPRQDIVQDMLPILGSSHELLQRGALDNLTATQLQNLAPNPGEQVLVSSLQDGTSVVMAETKVVNLLQDCIQELEKKRCTMYPSSLYRRLSHRTFCSDSAVASKSDSRRFDSCIAQYRETIHHASSRSCTKLGSQETMGEQRDTN